MTLTKVPQPAPGTSIADRSDGAILIMDAPADNGWPMGHVRMADGFEYSPRTLATLIAHGYWDLRMPVNLAPDRYYVTDAN